ncbi:MAG: hypothetical protein K2Q06_00135 [Parvularculaceae bacterium]|nr:hypothetical protein [Parvularculaceae bacterium]
MWMRTEKRLVKLQILVTDSELAAIDDWRFEARADNRSSAVRELMRLGHEKTQDAPEEVRRILESIRRH